MSQYATTLSASELWLYTAILHVPRVSMTKSNMYIKEKLTSRIASDAL